MCNALQKVAARCNNLESILVHVNRLNCLQLSVLWLIVATSRGLLVVGICYRGGCKKMMNRIVFTFLPHFIQTAKMSSYIKQIILQTSYIVYRFGFYFDFHTRQSSISM